MIDPILKAAEDRRDELRQELKKLDEFVIMYRSLAGAVKSEESNTTGTSSPQDDENHSVDIPAAGADREAESADAPPARRVRVRDNPKPEAVVEAAVKLIRQTGRPMTRREIREGLAAQGVVVNGADPVKALGTMLWRSGADKLEQIEGRGYWVRGVLVPGEGLRATELFS